MGARLVCVVGSHPHLHYYFHNHGQTDMVYRSNVSERFKQWVLDLCKTEYGHQWLDYHIQIGKRHTTKKGGIDMVEKAPEIVPY